MSGLAMNSQLEDEHLQLKGLNARENRKLRKQPAEPRSRVSVFG